jgi:hypothetical protein
VTRDDGAHHRDDWRPKHDAGAYIVALPSQKCGRDGAAARQGPPKKKAPGLRKYVVPKSAIFSSVAVPALFMKCCCYFARQPRDSRVELAQHSGRRHWPLVRRFDCDGYLFSYQFGDSLLFGRRRNWELDAPHGIIKAAPNNFNEIKVLFRGRARFWSFWLLRHLSGSGCLLGA